MKRINLTPYISTPLTAIVALFLAAGALPMRQVEAAPPESPPAQVIVNPGQASWKTGPDGNHTDMYLDPVGNSRLGIGTASPQQMLHVMGGLDANLNDNTGFVIIGDQDAANLVLDDNELLARHNGVPAPFYVQARGGRFVVGPDNGINLSIEENRMWARLISDPIPVLFPQGTDAKLDQVSGYVVVGDRLASNIVVDDNELMARHNGAASTLHLQAEGGALNVQQDKLVVSADGVVAVRGDKLVVTQEGHVGVGTDNPLGISGFGPCAYPCSHLAVSGNIHSSGGVNTAILWAKSHAIIGDSFDGKLGDFQDAELQVNGAIVAKEIVVTTDDWADAVFEEGYDLMPLPEVEASIRANGHLPGVPSASDVTAGGIDLGEMNRILLAKVEELTLYAIEQDKRITQVEQLLAAQAAQTGGE
jgi:hypothetical protein